MWSTMWRTVADAAGPDPVRGLLHVRGVVEPVGGHEGPAALAGEPRERAGIGAPGRHRLFDEHVASPAKRLRGVLEVANVWRSDDHAVRTAVVHLEVVLGDVGQVELATDSLELRRTEPAGRDQLRLAVLPDVGDVVFAGPPPGPDHRDARLLLHPCHRELPDSAGQSSVSVLALGTVAVFPRRSPRNARPDGANGYGVPDCRIGRCRPRARGLPAGRSGSPDDGGPRQAAGPHEGVDLRGPRARRPPGGVGLERCDRPPRTRGGGWTPRPTARSTPPLPPTSTAPLPPDPRSPNLAATGNEGRDASGGARIRMPPWPDSAGLLFTYTAKTRTPRKDVRAPGRRASLRPLRRL